MSDEMRIFIGYLKGKGLKLTKQRQEILDTFLKTDRHLSVEDLYDIVKRRDPSIGQATVFRTLKLLCEADIASDVDLGDKRVRYEHKYGHEDHAHLICVRCGRFIEAADPRIERLQEKLCEKHDFRPQSSKVDIFGICRACGGKKKRERD
jgi:Fur family ferric uptake transcriptional regulator